MMAAMSAMIPERLSRRTTVREGMRSTVGSEGFRSGSLRRLKLRRISSRQRKRCASRWRGNSQIGHRCGHAPHRWSLFGRFAPAFVRGVRGTAWRRMLVAHNRGDTELSDTSQYLRRDVWTTWRIAEVLAELLFATIRSKGTGPYRHPRHGCYLPASAPSNADPTGFGSVLPGSAHACGRDRASR